MTSDYRDRRIFEALQPDDVGAYLMSIGWTRAAADSSRADVWQNPAYGDEAFLLVPRSTQVRDYALRMAEVFRELAVLRGEPQSALLRAVTEVGADVVRLQRPSFNEADASIRLRDGASLISKALDLIAAAACAAVKPVSVLPPRRPPEAVDYMRRVEMGQTERGSYVVSLISRVTPQLTPGMPGLLEILDEPFPRRVTTTLARALGATQSAVAAVTADGALAAFESAVERGVSANLCDAIHGMVVQDESQAPIELAVTWARIRPRTDDAPSRFAFTPEIAPILRDAAAYLRTRDPEPAVLLTGVVVDLHREVSDLDGAVSVSTVLDGGPKKVRTRLAPPEYRMAIEAHDYKLAVMFRADLKKIGKSWHAENVREFRVIPRNEEGAV